MVEDYLSLHATTLRPSAGQHSVMAQMTVLAVLYDITSIPEYVSSVVAMMCIAITTPMLASKASGSKKWAKSMYAVLIAACVLVGAVCVVIYLTIGLPTLVRRFVTEQDFDEIYHLCKPLFGLSIYEIVLHSIYGTSKAATLSSSAFVYYRNVELLSSVLWFTVALVGCYTGLGVGHEVCFWVMLANEVKFTVEVIANGLKFVEVMCGREEHGLCTADNFLGCECRCCCCGRKGEKRTKVGSGGEEQEGTLLSAGEEL